MAHSAIFALQQVHAVMPLPTLSRKWVKEGKELCRSEKDFAVDDIAGLAP